jgi:hypothetical protein
MHIEAIIKEIDSLMEQATPRPWIAEGLPYDGMDDPCIIGGPDRIYVAQTVYDMQSMTQIHNVDADTKLIVALVNAWPAIRAALHRS